MTKKIKFIPKLLFIDDFKDHTGTIIDQIKQHVKWSYAEKFIKIHKLNKINSFDEGELNKKIRDLFGDEKIVLPGEEDYNEETLSIVNIILTNNNTGDNQLIEYLNKIKKITEFEEPQNNNFYILITNKEINLDEKIDIPDSNLGQVIISNTYSSGQNVKTEHYYNTIISVVSGLSVIGEKGTIINSLFFNNPADNIVTMRSDVISIPDKDMQEYMDATFLRALKNEVKASDKNVDISLEDIDIKALNIDEEPLKEKLKFFNRLIRIPFFQGQNQRNKYINNVINEYLTARHKFLNDKLQELKEWFHSLYPKDIDIRLSVKIRDEIKKNFSLASLKKRLEDLIEEFKESRKYKNNWKFISNNPEAFTVSDFPFQVIPLSVLGLMIITTIVLFFISVPVEFKIIMAGLSVVYLFVLLFSGKQYIKKYNNKLRSIINNDRFFIKEFIIQNSRNFRLSVRKLMYNDLINILNQYKLKLDKALENLEGYLQFEEYNELTEKISDRYNGRQINSINSEIKEITPAIITQTMRNNGDFILNDFENVQIFIDLALDELRRSEHYSRISKELFNIEELENRFAEIKRLMINHEISEDSKKMFLITPSNISQSDEIYKEKFPEETFDIIESPGKNTWYFMVVGRK
jgi:hypothetical protein